MKLEPPSVLGITPRRDGITVREQGLALVVVMVLVLSMAVIAGAFAYAMKIETRLSVRTQSSGELEWLGRSGVEFARWTLDQQRRILGAGRIHALNQFWAGGPGPTNDVDNPFLGMSLKNIDVGPGRISVEIVDAERKLNINRMNDPRRMQLILEQMGVVGGDADALINAIGDWRDPDNNPRAGNGAEDDYYLGMDPPYYAKNAPIDDISELLKIRGVSPELYWGGRFRSQGRSLGVESGPLSAVGLVDVFCAVSGEGVNVNTAPLPVLQVILGGDPFLAQQLITQRAGLDGVDGTYDDTPFGAPPNLGQLTAGGAAAAPGAGVGMTVTSSVFEIRVTAEIGGLRKRFFALFRQGGDRLGQVMVFHPDE